MTTEKRLIDANKAQAVLVNMAEHLMEAGNPEMAGTAGYAAEIIGKQKTVDAVEVVHGWWEWITEDIYGCTNCGDVNHVKEVMGQPDYNYCPNCGAKMDGERKDNGF